MMDKFDIRGEYSSIHSHFPASTPSPVIGITANYRDNNAMVAEAYYLSVLEAGGTPMIIPPYANRNALMETLRHVDALLLTGGADIDPRYMGQEPDYTLLHSINPKRDEQELLLVRLAVDMNIPILGICRGMQVLAVALGGDVHQDIYAALGDGLLNHDQEPAERHVATHDVRISNDTLLRRIFSCDTIAVNTFHHQSVRCVPAGFDVVATNGDFFNMPVPVGVSAIISNPPFTLKQQVMDRIKHLNLKFALILPFQWLNDGIPLEYGNQIMLFRQRMYFHTPRGVLNKPRANCFVLSNGLLRKDLIFIDKRRKLEDK